MPDRPCLLSILRWRTLAFLILVALAACARPAPPTPWSPAVSPVGIVLMHGKKGPPTYLANAKAVLESHGYLVSTPEMCWSDKRQYDRLYPDCVTEIDAAVADLERRGARSVVVAGHSMGGTAAVAYAATHDGIAGVVGIAAGDAFFGPISGLPDIGRARALVAAGRGGDVGDFADLTPRGDLRMRTTAAHFLSFVAPPAEQMMPAYAARARAPILFIAGTRDVPTLQYQATAFDRAPGYALNRFVRVDADHAGTVPAGLAPMLDWLDALARPAPL